MAVANFSCSIIALVFVHSILLLLRKHLYCPLYPSSHCFSTESVMTAIGTSSFHSLLVLICLRVSWCCCACACYISKPRQSVQSPQHGPPVNQIQSGGPYKDLLSKGFDLPVSLRNSPKSLRSDHCFHRKLYLCLHRVQQVFSNTHYVVCRICSLPTADVNKRKGFTLFKLFWSVLMQKLYSGLLTESSPENQIFQNIYLSARKVPIANICFDVLSLPRSHDSPVCTSPAAHFEPCCMTVSVHTVCQNSPRQESSLSLINGSLQSAAPFLPLDGNICLLYCLKLQFNHHSEVRRLSFDRIVSYYSR